MGKWKRVGAREALDSAYGRQLKGVVECMIYIIGLNPTDLSF